MPSDPRSFIYDPIPQDSDQIRLLRFFDSKTILIFHASLSNPPGYRALSYTWGNSLSDEPLQVLIDVDGELQPRNLVVTENCMGALKRLYEDDSLTPVWVDAICIDQNQDNERNHQVSLMSNIYSTAEKVQIDLGPGDQGTRRALRYIKQEYEFNLKSTGTPLQYFPYTDIAPLNVQESLSDILSRSWFTRVWVLQEVHFAKYAEVLCGKDKIPWSILRLLGIHYYENDHAHSRLTVSLSNLEPSTSSQNTAKIPPILSIAENQKVEKTLWHWLQETYSLKSTDPRDSVYALLGLASDVREGGFHLTADYTKTLAEVRLLAMNRSLVTVLNVACIKNGFKLEIGQETSLEDVLIAVLKCASQSGIKVFHISDFHKHVIMVGLKQLRRFSWSSGWWYSCCTSNELDFSLPTSNWIESPNDCIENTIRGLNRLQSLTYHHKLWKESIHPHPLFHDYLPGMSKHSDLIALKDDQQAHRMLADSCIKVMSTFLREDCHAVYAPGAFITDVDSSLLDQHIPSEVQYACKNWMTHLEDGRSQLHDDDQVHQFLQKYFLHWLEALGWMREAGSCVVHLWGLQSIKLVNLFIPH
jgi:hypothetical protein